MFFRKLPRRGTATSDAQSSPPYAVLKDEDGMAFAQSYKHRCKQTLASSLKRNLFESLFGSDASSAKMKELLTEDPVIAGERRFLQERLARLRQIKEKLDGFGFKNIKIPKSNATYPD
ncbi:hypothetical protein H0H81_010723 [Sphagnurus paluster]|uniref:Dynamin GTPase effector domain-containing protein n=1 Tax=Sphagnurus paluster TaxID=117069 RepID=A0A9P7KHS1_9AGAR|nr:hypothetical protein H0H81_010723 [Sphagnurus paluster]